MNWIILSAALVFLPMLAVETHADTRGTAIAKALDCVDQHLQGASPVSWSDVCSVDNSSSTSREHQNAVEDALDQYQDGEQLSSEKYARFPFEEQVDDSHDFNGGGGFHFELASEISLLISVSRLTI